MSFSGRMLLGGVWACVGLALFTPLLVDAEVVYPYVVPKALLARSLIAGAFLLWALLALGDARYRPPRSRVLLLLAAGAGMALLSALAGASADRSLWSTYERMLGVTDQLHWFVLALVLASVLREELHWRILLNVNLAVGLVVSSLAVLQAFGLKDSIFGPLVVDAVRYAATLGNPLYMGGYAMLTCILAVGLLLRSFEGAPEGGTRWLAGAAPWLGRCFLGATALVSAWALVLTVARGPMLGLLVGLAFGAFAYVALPGRPRWVRRTVFGLMALGAVTVGGLLGASALYGKDVHPAVRESIFRPLFGRAAHARTLHFRLQNWEAGWKGFLERPLLGWGPENFIAVWGRHYRGERDHLRTDDTAHNKIVEELVAKGAPGALLYLALWAAVASALRRGARRLEPGDRVTAIAVGAALLAYFVQSLTGPDSLPVLLPLTLLLAFAARLEAPRASGEEGPGAPPRPWVRGALASGAAALAAAGLHVNLSMWNGAREVNRLLIGFERQGIPLERHRAQLERALEAFRPGGTTVRPYIFQYVSVVWPEVAAGHPGEARATLALARAEAEAALRAEPENWEVYMSLAEMYAVLASVDPAFAGEAGHYRRRTRELAPHVDLAGMSEVFRDGAPPRGGPPEP